MGATTTRGLRHRPSHSPFAYTRRSTLRSTLTTGLTSPYDSSQRHAQEATARALQTSVTLTATHTVDREADPTQGRGDPEGLMNVLLLSMPDAFEHMPPIAIRMPNGALPSLAANVDPHHHVGTADLILMHGHIREVVRDLVAQVQPDVIGLSVMTFQRPTAFKIAQFVRSLRPKAAIVAGGYDPSLAPEAYTTPDSPFDFVVRGEGEATFRLLLRALEGHEELAGVSGLTWRQQDTFIANPARHVSHSPGEDLKLPDRGSRLLSGYTMLGRQIDVVETSRGCTFDCSFCSIIEMRGRNFHPFPIERVIADLMDARARGARMVFLVDDNIMLDVQALCGVVRSHHRRGAERHPLCRAGDDLVHREPWRRAGAAHAARQLPVRLSGD